jgi:hypothetical protein
MLLHLEADMADGFIPASVELDTSVEVPFGSELLGFSE